jgi:hypothetical protein
MSLFIKDPSIVFCFDICTNTNQKHSTASRSYKYIVNRIAELVREGVTGNLIYYVSAYDFVKDVCEPESVLKL